MKITILTNLYPPFVRGGAEYLAHQLALELASQQHDVAVITSAPFSSLRQWRPEMRLEGGLRVYRFWPLNIYHYLTGPRVPKALRFVWQLINLFNWPAAWTVKRILQRERPELVISYNLMGLSFLLPRLIKKLGLKQVHTLHDVQLLHPSGLFMYGQAQTSAAMRAYQFITRWLFAGVATVVSPSAWLLQTHQQQGFFKASRCLVVPNPVPWTPVEPAIKTARPPFKISYVGQIAEHKGVYWLIKNVKRCRRQDFELHLVAIGLNPELGKLKEAIGQDKRFIIQSGLTQKEIDTQVSESHLSLVPSLCYENSPTAISKAGLAGTAVLAADLGGIPELVQVGVTGWLFKPGDGDDFLKRFKWCLDHPDDLLRAGLKASQVFEQRTLNNYARQIVAQS